MFISIGAQTINLKKVRFVFHGIQQPKTIVYVSSFSKALIDEVNNIDENISRNTATYYELIIDFAV